MSNNIIVTGGAGYIGSHTVIDLIESGYNPIIVDNFSNSNHSVIDNLERICNTKINSLNINCTNKNELVNNIDWQDITGIIHFAALKSVSESFEKKKKYFFNNIESTKVLIDIAEKYNIDNFVFSSSCTVYGSPDLLPVTEKTKLKKALSPYGETKKICEDIIKTSKIKNYHILRYFNPIGAHKSSLIGENPKNKPNNLVPLICQCGIGKRKLLTIYGNNYSTRDGTCIRDYIHVSDVAQAHVCALNNMIGKKNCKEVLNIGLSKGVSVLELVKLFEKSNNIKINYIFGKKREGDIEEIYADCKLAQKKINWKPKYSISQALIDAWKWEIKNKLN